MKFSTHTLGSFEHKSKGLEKLKAFEGYPWAYLKIIFSLTIL